MVTPNNSKLKTQNSKLQNSEWLFWVYLLLVTGAELLTSLVSPMVGLLSHTVLLIGLVVHGALGRTDGERTLGLALALAPMIRILSLSMPLINFPQSAWYPMTAVPLIIATYIIVRQQGIPRQALGFRGGNPALQLMFAGAGLGLGAVEYLILHPEPLVSSLRWEALLLPALSLAIFTGFNEELIFRGLLQAASLPVLGRRALLYVSLLFGALHIGYLSVLDVLFVTAVGLLFAQIARWSGSILGVTLAHALTNITLFLIMPYLANGATAEVLGAAIWACGAGTLAALTAIGILWSRSLVQGPRFLVPGPDAPVLEAETGDQEPQPLGCGRFAAPHLVAPGSEPAAAGVAYRPAIATLPFGALVWATTITNVRLSDQAMKG